MCGQALLWRRIGPFLLTKTSCMHCRFQCISSICWACFSDTVILPGFRKLLWIRLATDHQTVTMTFFWCKSGLGKCVGASWSSHWASHRRLWFKIHFSSHVTIQSRNGSLLLHAIREDTSKWWFFFTCSQLMRHPAIKFFAIPICFKCQTTLEWSMLSSSATSHVTVRESVSMTESSQSIVVNFQWPATLLLIFKALVSFAKLAEPPLHCKSVSSSWVKCIVDVAVVTTVYDLFQTQIRKFLEFAFLSNIISIV